MKATLWNILNKYEYLGDFSDSISRVIQGTESNSDYMVIYGNYLNLDNSDLNDIDEIVGDNIGAILA